MVHMHDWTIERMFDEHHLDGVLEVEVASFLNPWTREMYQAELRDRELTHLYVLRTPTYPVAGFCSFWLVLDELHVNNLAVRPQCRRLGYGSALLTHVLAQGARMGAEHATLEVRRSNIAALSLYSRHGFEVVGARRSYYAKPVEDALILWKRGLAEIAPSPGRRA